MKKRYYIIILLVVLITLIISIINDQHNNHINIEGDTEEGIGKKSYKYDRNIIENIKKEINVTANTDIYMVEEEHDGRKILQIKPSVQFEVDLAGIIKNSIPQEKEINDLISKMPTKNGIWISNQSRERFLELLKKNNIENFYISNEGYLKTDKQDTDDAISNKIKNMIDSNKLYIINMTGTSYQRDYISGEIIEYPFEEMDPFQIIEPYESNNKISLEVNTNRYKKLTDKEIIEAIIEY